MRLELDKSDLIQHTDNVSSLFTSLCGDMDALYRILRTHDMPPSVRVGVADVVGRHRRMLRVLYDEFIDTFYTDEDDGLLPGGRFVVFDDQGAPRIVNEDVYRRVMEEGSSLDEAEMADIDDPLDSKQDGECDIMF